MKQLLGQCFVLLNFNNKTNKTFHVITGKISLCTLSVLLGMLIFQISADAQSAGFNTSYAVFKINGTSGQRFKMLSYVSDTTRDLDGQNLGSFVYGASTLILQGAQLNVWKCGGADITATHFNYSIYKTSSGPSGIFQTLNIGWASEVSNGCGGADQLWQDISQNINLLSGLSVGTYTLNVYADAPSTVGTQYLSNGGPNYKASFTITAAPLTITANGNSKTYGQNYTVGAGSTAFTSSGLQNSETIGSITIASTGAASTAAVGSYTIVPSAATGGTFTASNYSITYVNGTLTVNKASLTITANSGSKTYGQAYTVGAGSTAFTSSGLQNSETIGSVTIASTGAASTSAVGSYSIVPSAVTGGTFTASNYNITYVNGTLTVNKASLTITANSGSKTYGQTYTVGAGSTAFTSSGLQNSETIGSVTIASTGAASTSAVGSYSIVPSAATGGTFTASNYNITYVNGTLTVNTASLTITANSGSKTYGQAYTVGAGSTAFTSSGLQNSETIGSVTIASTGAASTSAVGSYSIVPSAATGGTFTASNYNITYVNGTLTVNPLSLNFTGSKTFDGTSTFSASQLAATNIISGDVVTLGGNATVSSSSVGTYTSFATNSLTSSNANYAVTGGTVNVSITVCTTDTWQGTVSTDWSNGSNWSCGVPTSTSNVAISGTAPYYPSLTSNAAIHDIDIQGSSTVTIGNNIFTINGAITGTGTLKGSSSSKLIISGTAGTLKFATGSELLDSFALNTSASATLGTILNIAGGSIAIPGQLTVGNSAVLNTGDGLTLLSDDNNTAIVGPVGGTINGKVTVQRYIRSSQNPYYASSGNTIISNAKRAWRMMTAPVSGTATIFDSWQNGAPSTYIAGQGTMITGPGANTATNGLDGGINQAYSLKDFNTSTQALVNVANTKVPISNNSGSADNKGYFIFIRGDRDTATIGNPNFGGLLINNTTLSAKGNLQTGTQTFTVPASPDESNPKFQIIGNPYASPVDLTKVTFNNIAPYVYTWDPGLNQVGGYVTLNASSGYTVSAPTTGSNQNKYIQSGQAFMVYGNTGTGTTNVVFNESSKVNNNNNLVFRPNSLGVSFRSDLYLLNNDNSIAIADGNLVQFDNSYNAGVDFYDAPKLGNINETFGLLRNGRVLSIESRPLIINADTLFFNLTKTTQRNYQFRFMPTAISTGLKAFLKDSYKNDSTQLSLTDSTVVNFGIDANTASQVANRFMIVFEPDIILPVTYTHVAATYQANNIVVSWSVQNQVGIKEYAVEKSTDGIAFKEAAVIKASSYPNDNFNWVDINGVNNENYYRIRSVGNNGVSQYSQIVKLAYQAHPSIAVYPSIVTGESIALQFINQPQGLYDLRLLNSAGQLMLKTSISHQGVSSTETLNLPSNLAQGLYKLEIISPQKAEFTQSLIIK